MVRTGRKPKRGVTQSERIFLRSTYAMKSQLQQASRVSSAGTITDFVQQAVEVLAPAVIDLNECRITEEQFKSIVGNAMLVLATPSPSASASPSPSPEPEEGGDCE